MKTQQILEFLNLLKENNNRDWFAAHKSLYQAALTEFESGVTQLISGIQKFDSSIGVLTAKECLFRIYRDIRFSTDKTPYKTNFGAYIVNGGRKSWDAGYYFHFEPAGSLLAGGLYMPPPEKLSAARQEIYYNSEEFLKIIENKEFKKYFGVIDGRKTKKAPKDFDPDFKYIDLLKYKDYTLLHKLDEKILLSDGLIPYATRVFEAMYPFNCFFNEAIRQNK
jgi:uncharacterized protein (TIGR02453 family)